MNAANTYKDSVPTWFTKSESMLFFAVIKGCANFVTALSWIPITVMCVI